MAIEFPNVAHGRPYVHLRRVLDGSIPDPVWPVDTRPVASADRTKVREAHALMMSSYSRDGGGHVSEFDAWWSSVSGDVEYDPAALFLVLDASDGVIAVALCWSGGFLKDIVVDRGWRRRGVGTALLLHVFHAFRHRGVSAVELKVEIGNPSGAERLYRRLRMTPAV